MVPRGLHLYDFDDLAFTITFTNNSLYIHDLCIGIFHALLFLHALLRITTHFHGILFLLGILYVFGSFRNSQE